MPFCYRTFKTETGLRATSIEIYIVHVDKIGFSMLISVEVFEWAKPSIYMCEHIGLLFYVVMPGIINILKGKSNAYSLWLLFVSKIY